MQPCLRAHWGDRRHGVPLWVVIGTRNVLELRRDCTDGPLEREDVIRDQAVSWSALLPWILYIELTRKVGEGQIRVHALACEVY